MSSNSDLVKQFSDITGISEERAKFYLDAANGELQAALSSFYEGENDELPAEAAAAPVDGSDEDNLMNVSPIQFSRSGVKPKGKKAPKAPSNIATLRSLNSSSSDDEEEQGQAFYAGGSERSGQQVLGPPKKNPIKDYVSEIFRSAQQGNLETFDPSDESSGSGSSLYHGTAYRLGQTEDDHQEVPSRGGAAAAAAARAGAPAQSNHEVVTLTLWRQGFTINDGELRRYEDPENKEFFESIMRGETPEELRSKGPTMIRVDLKDNRHEEYVKRTTPFRPFGGSAQTLGSPVPPMTTSSSSSSSSGAAAGAGSTENEKRASNELAVDESQPTTTLQIRLNDGTRLSGRFNQSHTIDQVRQYITSARPQFAEQSFALMTTFPSKELTDGSQTLKEAGLLNAAIMQRLK